MKNVERTNEMKETRSHSIDHNVNTTFEQDDFDWITVALMKPQNTNFTYT